MEKLRFEERVGCEMVGNIINVSRWHSEDDTNARLAKLFNILFDRFIQRLQEDHGSYYGVTDSCKFERLLNCEMFDRKEDFYVFVLHGKIVNIATNHAKIDGDIGILQGLFGIISSFVMSANHQDLLLETKDYFLEFIGQQDFDELEKIICKKMQI